MECFENGLLTLEDTDGLDLRFGNADAMVTMVEWIALRKGIGDLLAEGVKRAAEKIGGDSHKFANHVKGQELPMHDPRGKYNVGMMYAISEIGADHLVTAHDGAIASPDSVSFKNARPLGITEPQPVLSLNEGKMRAFYSMEKVTSLEKVIGYCFFGPAPRSYIELEEVVESVNVVTDWDVSLDDLLEIGERATNMARVFNAREGFTRKDDTLPERLFGPLENGKLEGECYPKDDFETALTTLYQIKGWDPERGIPTQGKLESLSLGWAADLIKG